MGYRLKSRQTQIPNGYKFIQPETGWQAPRFASFAVIVQNLIAHRKSRPDLVAQHGWPIDIDNVGNELEQFNVRLCLQHGWTDYLDGLMGGEGAIPKSKPPSQSEIAQVSAAGAKAVKIWAGVRTLNDWIDSGEPPVPQDQSTARALKCSTCVKNTKGDFTSWFTKPAAGAIKRQIEQLQERKLSTPHDLVINVCETCLCPLKLKVHTPLPFIKAHMSETVLRDLQAVDTGCWVVDELAAK